MKPVSRAALDERRKRILEEPRIARLILELSIPLFVSGSLQSLYGVADTFWLSRLGSAALGTPTVSWPYRGILMSIGFGLASSLSALVGQYVGAGDYRRASKSVGTVLGLLLALGAAGSMVLYAYRGLYLDVTRTPSDVAGLASVYIGVTLAGIPFTYAFLVFNFALGAAGDTRTPMKVSVATTLLNFALDPLMIFGMGLGVLGAALATLFSNAIAGVYGLYSLLSGAHGIHVTPRDLAPERGIAALALRVGGPTTMQRLLTTLGFLVMVGIVNGLGTPVIAAYSIGQVILSLDHVIVFPLVRSTGIVVAQSLGAGLIARARSAVLTGLGMLSAAVGGYTLAIIAARDFFISAFTRDPAVASSAERMVLIFGPSVIGFNLLVLATSIASSSGHTLLVSGIGATRLWGLRIPLSYLLAYRLGYGDTGLWLGMAISNYIAGIAALAWLLSFKWAKPIINGGARRHGGRANQYRGPREDRPPGRAGRGG